MKIKNYIGYFIALIVISCSFASAIGISPSKVSFFFEPNLHNSIDFSVTGVGEDYDVYTYIRSEDFGELNGSIKLVNFTDYGEVKKFSAVIDLPSSSAGLTPGNHRILIGAKEVPKSSKVALAALAAVQTPINIFVKYAGKYLRVSLSAVDSDKGSMVPISATFDNLGSELLEINSYVNIYEGDKLIGKVNIPNIILNVEESKTIQVFWNSSGYSDDIYNATLVANYGSINDVRAYSSFKLGSIFVDIIDFTNKLKADSIEKFYIALSSRWNSPIYNAYAVINLFKDASLIKSFKTADFDIASWENKKVEDFVDTNGIKPGEYTANVTLYYNNKVSSLTKEIKITRGIDYFVVALILFVLILIIVIIFLILWIKRSKDKKKRSKSSKK